MNAPVMKTKGRGCRKKNPDIKFFFRIKNVSHCQKASEFQFFISLFDVLYNDDYRIFNYLVLFHMSLYGISDFIFFVHYSAIGFRNMNSITTFLFSFLFYL